MKVYKTEKEWDEIVKKQIASNMTMKDFCKQEGLNYKTYASIRSTYFMRDNIKKDISNGTSKLEEFTKSESLENSGLAKISKRNSTIDEISRNILNTTNYVLENELNKFLSAYGDEKDIKQINVSKLKDLSVSVLKTAYYNDIQLKRLELEIIKSNMEAERLVIEKEKLMLEKIKLGLIKTENEDNDSGFVDALKQTLNVWNDENERDED